jgi:hypothetical protein
VLFVLDDGPALRRLLSGARAARTLKARVLRDIVDPPAAPPAPPPRATGWTQLAAAAAASAVPAPAAAATTDAAAAAAYVAHLTMLRAPRAAPPAQGGANDAPATEVWLEHPSWEAAVRALHRCFEDAVASPVGAGGAVRIALRCREDSALVAPLGRPPRPDDALSEPPGPATTDDAAMGRKRAAAAEDDAAPATYAGQNIPLALAGLLT